MYQSKAAVKSLGVIAPILTILVIALSMFGIDISGDVVGLPEKIASAVDQIVIIGGLVLGIIGRVRATKEISGVFKDKPTS